ncbi:NAD(P)-dependent alcohol dehydrogenase [Bacillus infantis]|uniref:NAD(P)-dependent alcohol dehydrogenase n=1 Tax=Bacillus infantis TaxID=324767 RepID=UPI003CEE1F0F
MKAIISEKYGSPEVLKLAEIDKPVPGDDQVLVKIHAASINFGNFVLLKGEPFLARFAFGLFKPNYLIPGGDMAGVVEAAGKKVKQFRPGDKVFGDLSGSGWGSFAEYAAVPESSLALMPAGISFTEAAAVPMAAATALQSLRDKGKIKKGQKVMIYGASGGVGTFAVQIAKSFEAEVTGVCSTGNIDILQALGADRCIDYKKTDFTVLNDQYDLILGVNGSNSIRTYRRSLRPDGQFVHVGGSGKQMFQALMMGPWVSLTGRQKVGSFLQRHNQKDLIFLADLIEEGKVRPIIDRIYSLEDVPEAFRYFAEGHARGKVVISMSHSPSA